MEDTLEDIRKEITALKDSVEESKLSVSKLEGRREELVDKIRNRFGVTDMVAAERKLATLGKKRAELKKQVTELYNKLVDAMEQVEENE